MGKARKAPEAEWLALGNPERILTDRHREITTRKTRLFVCACMRHLHTLLPQLPYGPVFEMAERVADGTATREQLRTVTVSVPFAWQGMAADWAKEAVWFLRQEDYSRVVEHAARAARDQARGRDWSAAQKQQTMILCDILGHLLHPTAIFDPVWLRWNDGTVRKMAEAIYQDNTFADVPILADALEEAGCENFAILHHCRAKIRHYRGCWVVDAILGWS